MSLGCCARARGRVAQRALQDDDDRVALADLALRDDAPEPAPVVADGHVGGAGWPTAADAPRLGDALDQAPRLGLGEGQAGGAMAQAQRLADLALGERTPRGPSGRRGRGRSRVRRPTRRPCRPRRPPGVSRISSAIGRGGRLGRPGSVRSGSDVGHAAMLPRCRNADVSASARCPPARSPAAGRRYARIGPGVSFCDARARSRPRLRRRRPPVETGDRPVLHPRGGRTAAGTIRLDGRHSAPVEGATHRHRRRLPARVDHQADRRDRGRPARRRRGASR